MTRVAIIAAMPGELKPLVRGWPHSTRGTIHFWAQRTEEELLACKNFGQTSLSELKIQLEQNGLGFRKLDD